jgi:hypothetical protein
MPGLDGRGPLGAGPMSGRGMGNCVVSNRTGNVYGSPGRGMGRGPGMGRGTGRGRGMGRGFNRGFRQMGVYANPVGGAYSAQEELDMLKNEAELLKQDLSAIESRMSDLEKKEQE